MKANELAGVSSLITMKAIARERERVLAAARKLRSYFKIRYAPDIRNSTEYSVVEATGERTHSLI